MLKNSKIEYNWIFQIINGYYNRVFVISVVFSFAFFFYLFFVLFFWSQRRQKDDFFREFTCIYGLYICIYGVHELGTLNIRIHHSLTVYDNSWALKFYNFSEFQNVISDSPPPTPQLHYDPLRTKIDMWLTRKDFSSLGLKYFAPNAYHPFSFFS